MSEIGTVGSATAQASLMTGSISNMDMAKDDFLKLLITELQHQDPLSPMDSQDFAAQLAQFSSLEQLQSIDNNIGQGVELDLILTQAINNTLAATIIGKTAKAVGDTVTIETNGSAELNFRLGGYAKDVTVSIFNEAGNEVRVLSAENLAQGEQSITWDGKNQDGESVLPGTYTFKVEATDLDDNSVYVMTLIKGNVTGVRYEEGRAVLIINGEEIPFSTVLEIGIREDS